MAEDNSGICPVAWPYGEAVLCITAGCRCSGTLVSTGRADVSPLCVGPCPSAKTNKSFHPKHSNHFSKANISLCMWPWVLMLNNSSGSCYISDPLCGVVFGRDGPASQNQTNPASDSEKPEGFYLVF